MTTTSYAGAALDGGSPSERGREDGADATGRESDAGGPAPGRGGDRSLAGSDARTIDQDSSGDTDSGLSDDDSLNFQQSASVINQFFSDVNAAGATFGNIGAVSTRRTTGRIAADRVAELLRGYVRPQPFGEAIGKLTANNVLVLSGDEGIGKRIGALAVLDRVLGAGRSVTSLAPSLTLLELAAVPFQAGRGYLVQDWIGDASSSALWQFAVDQLRRAVEKAGSGTYLVLTGQFRQAERRQLEDLIVEWAAPPPGEVFDARILTSDTELAPELRELIMPRVEQLRRPRDVVAVAELADQGVDTAFAVLGEADHRKVAEWFDGKPSPRQLLSAAALCFLDGMPDLLFQELLSRLVVLVNEHATADSVTRSAAATALDEAFPQHVKGDSTLDTVELDDTDDGAPRARKFASPHFRERVIAELVARYGFELWQPMRAWIDEVAGLASSPTQAPVALGVAVLARHAPDRVESLLDEWSNGLAPERLTAAYVLSWMCVDDGLAAVALRIAQRWTSRSGARRAATAALAFAGGLGIRYQSLALNRLWHLTLRMAAVSDSAGVALGLLLSSAVDDATATKTILWFLRSALRKLVDHRLGVPVNGNYFRQVAKALSVIRKVLCHRPPGAAESLTATILRTLPGCVATLGDLWAEVLRSAKERGSALDELCRVLAVLADEPNGPRVIAEFGAAVRAHLSHEENRLLRMQVADVRRRGNQAHSGALIDELRRALGDD